MEAAPVFTEFLSHTTPTLASSYQSGNSVFLSPNSSSSLQLQTAERGDSIAPHNFPVAHLLASQCVVVVVPFDVACGLGVYSNWVHIRVVLH